MTELAPHQHAAVARVRELLDRYGGALLADEVGLGKSFVAAALMQECAGTEIELILPAALVTQWRETLRAFDVDARIVTHDALARAPFMADATRERLVIVDEAHAFRNPHTQRWAALARRSIAARLLLITATPICNSLADLASLIHLIAADDALRDQGVHSIEAAFRERDRGGLAAITSMLVIRRERDVLPAALRFGTLVSDIVRHPVLTASIDTLEFPLVGETQLLHRFLWRRLESSEEALLESVDRQLRFYDRARDALRRGRVLTKREYRRAFGDDDSLQQVLFWEIFAPQSSHGDAQALDDEAARLRTIRAEIAASPRLKLQLLRDVVAAIGDPILIFTGHIASANAIFGALRTTRTCGLVTARNGRDAIDAFVRGRLDVLVTTDLAAEGLNLQRAGAVIHYDLPWNPVKVDQRNGRAHRIGQRRPSVRAIYFVPEEERTGTSGIVARKNETRVATLRPTWFSFVPVDPALPQHIPRDSAPASLIRAIERRRTPVPPALLRRFRAGAERLMAEMANEHLDAARLDWLVAILVREREVVSIRPPKGERA